MEHLTLLRLAHGRLGQWWGLSHVSLVIQQTSWAGFQESEWKHASLLDTQAWNISIVISAMYCWPEQVTRLAQIQVGRKPTPCLVGELQSLPVKSASIGRHVWYSYFHHWSLQIENTQKWPKKDRLFFFSHIKKSRNYRMAPQRTQWYRLPSFCSATSVHLLLLRLPHVPKWPLKLQPSSLHSRPETERIGVERRENALKSIPSHPTTFVHISSGSILTVRGEKTWGPWFGNFATWIKSAFC